MDKKGNIKFGGRDGILTWRLLSGSRMESFKWPDGRKKFFDYGFKGQGNRYPVMVEHNGQKLTVNIMHNNTATTHYADLAADYRDGKNSRKLEILGRFLSETGPESYTEQLHSEYRTTERNKPKPSLGQFEKPDCDDGHFWATDLRFRRRRKAG